MKGFIEIDPVEYVGNMIFAVNEIISVTKEKIHDPYFEGKSYDCACLAFKHGGHVLCKETYEQIKTKLEEAVK